MAVELIQHKFRTYVPSAWKAHKPEAIDVS